MNADQILDQIHHLVDKNFAQQEKGREDFHIQLLSSKVRELVMHLNQFAQEFKSNNTEH